MKCSLNWIYKHYILFKVCLIIVIEGNAGGLLGLYLGFSVVSALEIFYHFVFKLLVRKNENGKYVLCQQCCQSKREF